MTEELRNQNGSRVVRAMQEVGYSSVGTLEFLVDEKNQFFFMEMNTRIQSSTRSPNWSRESTWFAIRFSSRPEKGCRTHKKT